MERGKMQHEFISHPIFCSGEMRPAVCCSMAAGSFFCKRSQEADRNTKPGQSRYISELSFHSCANKCSKKNNSKEM